MNDHKLHFGNWLKRQIENTGEPVSAIARMARIRDTTLRGWLKSDHPPIRGYNRARICNVLKMPREVFDQKLAEASPQETAAA